MTPITTRQPIAGTTLFSNGVLTSSPRIASMNGVNGWYCANRWWRRGFSCARAAGLRADDAEPLAVEGDPCLLSARRSANLSLSVGDMDSAKRTFDVCRSMN